MRSANQDRARRRVAGNGRERVPGRHWRAAVRDGGRREHRGGLHSERLRARRGRGRLVAGILGGRAAHGDRLKAGEKKMLEISIVRKGAREGCHISAYQDAGGPVVFKPTAEPARGGAWDCFEM